MTLPPSTLDHILKVQLAVAWAGEGGDEPRLGWWRTDLVSEFGGEDLFKRLLPSTWRWATLQAAREAARRQDAVLRAKDHDPDRLLTLFRLGFEIDEQLDERLATHKQSGKAPSDALPALAAVTESWDRDQFTSWIELGPTPAAVAAPAGRRLKGAPPLSMELLVQHLLGALLPLSDEYPLPHYKSAP